MFAMAMHKPYLCHSKQHQKRSNTMKKRNNKISVGDIQQPLAQSNTKAFRALILFVMSTILGTFTSFGMNSLYLDASKPSSDNTIVYTATAKISPKLWGFDPYNSKYKDPDCDFQVVSHTYNSATGQGMIVLNKPIKVIAVGAFAKCEALTNITIPSSVTTIKNGAFTCSGLERIYIPDTVTEIGRGAFMRCRQLKEARLPEDITYIPRQLFYHCESLVSFTIPDGVTEIGSMAFFGCKSLKQIDIPDNVTEIDDNAFIWCISMERFSGKYATDDGCVLIKDGSLLAFANGRALESYTIPSEVIKICDCAIWNSHISSITLGKNITYIGCQGINCNNIKTVYCDITTPPTTIKGSYHRHHLEPDGDEYFESAPYIDLHLAINYIYAWRGLGEKRAAGHPNYDEEFTIYIPQGTIEQYKSAEGWRSYSDYYVETSDM